MNSDRDLRWADWEAFRTSSSLDLSWKALETLVNHLDDHLVVVDDRDFQELDFPTSPARLTVFEARDRDRTQLFALATTDGHVIVGRCDRLNTYSKQQLAGFDPLWDEILSLAVTGGHRWLGDHLDLWVMVRRHHRDDAGGEGSPEPCLPWNSPAEQSGQAVAKAGPGDDQELKDQRVWQAQAADRLPEWLRSYSLSFTPGIDPFAGFPGEKLCGDVGNIDTMTWARSGLCYACGDELGLIHEQAIPLTLAERARALALVEDPAGGIRGLAGCEDRRLVAFEEQGGKTQVPWHQTQRDFPQALAFLPLVERDHWPDLLVAYRDGRLQRLRHVGQNAVREVWDRCWDRLGLTGPDERIEAARKYIQEANQDRRSVSLWGAVEAVLTRSVSAKPAQNDVWLAELSELFRTDARGRRPVRLALEHLLQELESFAAGKSPRRPLPQGDFLSALIPIPRFYRDWLPVPDRERVDQTVRTSNWSYKVTGDPAVKELKERAPNAHWVGSGTSQRPCFLSRSTSIRSPLSWSAGPTPI